MRNLFLLISIALLTPLSSFSQVTMDTQIARPELVSEINEGVFNTRRYTVKWTASSSGIAFVEAKTPGIASSFDLYQDGLGEPTASFPGLLFTSFYSANYAYPYSEIYQIRPALLADVAGFFSLSVPDYSSHFKLKADYKVFGAYGFLIIFFADPGSTGRLTYTVKDGIVNRATTTSLLQPQQPIRQKLYDEIYCGDCSFTAWCDESQLLTPTGSTNKAKLEIYLDLVSKEVFFDIRHNIKQVTKMTLHLGDASTPQNSQPIYTINNPGKLSRIVAKSSELFDILDSLEANQITSPVSLDLFAVFHSELFPNGEVRGHFKEDQDL